MHGVCRLGPSSPGVPCSIRVMADSLKQAIKENACGPKRAAGDAHSVEQHSLRDVIEADRYISTKDAIKRPGLGIKLTRLIPPGTTG